jgi:two-component system sensor histidine kinase MtrB
MEMKHIATRLRDMRMAARTPAPGWEIASRLRATLGTRLRQARAMSGRLQLRWHRSLQLRVAATTAVISVAVVALLGVFLVQQIAAGLLANERSAALHQAENGFAYAKASQLQTQYPRGPLTLVRKLQSASGSGDVYYVVLLLQNSGTALTGVLGNEQLSKSIPRQLQAAVSQEQSANRADRMFTQPTMLLDSSGHPSQPALAVGIPVSSTAQMYYLFPLTQQRQILSLVQTTVISAGAVLVLLLVAIVSLVTRWVVLPIRRAAEAASRLSAGMLEERMTVRGADDLAALARSFNKMAVSLRDKIAELEALSSAQRQFVSDVSHELRTPLATIRIAADVLMAAKEQFDPAAGRSAELLQSQLERFEALLADLLEISRYDANVVTLDAESADVCDLVRRAAADAEQLAARRGTRIIFRFPPQPCIAEVDRRRIERVLRNLLDNAVEHGEGRDIAVTVASDRDAVAVAVRDHGVGFRPGDEQRVFERFWRADPARARTTGGTGLGLAIALEDTRLHNGWLQAWGEQGNGSVFRLTLPIASGRDLAGSPLPLGPDEGEVDAGTDVVSPALEAGGVTEVSSDA